MLFRSYINTGSADALISAHPSTSSSSSGRTPEDVIKMARGNLNALKWPIVVDWHGGRAAIGDLEGVKRILEELRKKRDGE